MLNQRLQQKLLQKLSPQQIQLMKLLQLPTIALEQRIKQEIEENPALEETSEELENNELENEINDEESFNEDAGDDENTSEIDSDDKLEKEIKQDDEFNLNDYIDEDDTPSYKLNANNTSADDEHREMPLSSGVSFQDFLLSQLGLRVLDDKQYQIASYILGNIDESGYLLRELQSMVDDIAFSLNISTTVDELRQLLNIIKEFDPPGVGAENLQDCLLIQLQRKSQDVPEIKLATYIIQNCFTDFTKKHYDKILKKLEISEETLKSAIDEILKLNPKPGNSVNDVHKIIQYIIPDFIIFNTDGALELVLNTRNIPELRVNRSYTEMLKTYSEKQNSQDKEAFMFVKQKLDAAKWFIDAIKQRNNTLYLTMHAIMEYQKEYFLEGDETLLKPMILKDIAERVNLDISTVSRVANSKYVQTSFGTFLLKTFFSESLTTDSGEEVSTREVKKILSDIIGNENKKQPVTDDELAKILNAQGYNIARRTVAKYREQLGIAVARLRKEL